MKTMLTSFLVPRQESTRIALYNHLAFETENLEERDFQTFINKAVTLLRGVQSRIEERNRQSQEAIFSAPVPFAHMSHRLTSRSQISQQPLSEDTS